MAVTRQPVQIPDIAMEDAYRGPLRDILLGTGTRALLAIPMLREDELIGGFTVSKKTPGAFAPEVIELLQTFATRPPWPSRTPGSSARSRTRAGSSRPRAATSPSSWPICRTSSGRP
jgi:GAF domain